MELIETMKAQALKDIEALLKNQLAVAYDPAVAVVADKLKGFFPGQIDDAAIDIIFNAIKPLLKEELLKQVEKVSAA